MKFEIKTNNVIVTKACFFCGKPFSLGRVVVTRKHDGFFDDVCEDCVYGGASKARATLAKRARELREGIPAALRVAQERAEDLERIARDEDISLPGFEEWERVARPYTIQTTWAGSAIVTSRKSS